MLIQDGIMDFIDYLYIEKGLSKNTIEAYREDLELFLRSCPEITDISEISEDHIRKFIRNQTAHGLEAKSVIRRISTIKNFLLYLQENIIIQYLKSRIQKSLFTFQFI